MELVHETHLFSVHTAPKNEGIHRQEFEIEPNVAVLCMSLPPMLRATYRV